MRDRLGRYEVLGVLGEGAQGTVFRCRDPQLERTVAVKWLSGKGVRGPDLDQSRLHEARMMSRVQHPNIVTVHDVGIEDGVPFLVFEFVQGELLYDMIRGRCLGVAEIVDFSEGILEGVAEAHRCGVVHRDLKPGNIIVSEDGLAKVMDFGIAQVSEQDPGKGSRIVGTPRYLAPEYVRDGRVSTGMDVFALGAIIYEMVAARPAFDADTAQGLLEEVVSHQPRPLQEFNEEIHGRLSALVTKALEKDPDARFADAAEMLEALRAYRASMGEGMGPNIRSGDATVEFLIRRMQRNSDFPALSDAIATLNRLVSLDDEDVTPLSGLIIKDYALTSKILKVVNSAYYNRLAGGVGTISRAIIVLGTKAVRSIAASLIFFEHLHDKAQARRLKDRVAASLFSAVFARRLAQSQGVHEAEEYLLCAMLHRLGELLVTYYLPDESRDIERLIAQEEMDGFKAQHRVLGTSYQDIGVRVAREWNFPEHTVQSMRALDADSLARGDAASNSLRVVANFSNEVIDVLELDGPELDRGLESTLDRYHAVLAIDGKALDALLRESTEEFLAMTREWGGSGARVSFLAALEHHLGAGDPHGPRAAEGVMPGAEAAPAKGTDPDAVLANGLQEVTNLLLERHTLTQVFNVVIETMYRGMGFERVVLSLCNPRDETMAAKLGFGPDIHEYMLRFRFDARYAADVFHVALRDNADIHISDTRDGGVRQNLPAWYQVLGLPGSFLIFPVVVGDRAVGMLYGDHPDPRGFDLTPSRLDLLKALRNQTAMAVLMSMNAGSA